MKRLMHIAELQYCGGIRTMDREATPSWWRHILNIFITLCLLPPAALALAPEPLYGAGQQYTPQKNSPARIEVSISGVTGRELTNIRKHLRIYTYH